MFSEIEDFFNQYQFLIFALRIILAGVCGFALGLERFINNKSAGVRTHVVVCCASALFMIVSIYGFVGTADIDGTRGADTARIAAQVVTGISFLGAGMIFKDGDAIKGLTSAAGIWSTAAIGLAIGAGMYFISIFVTAFIIIFMIVVSKSRLAPSRDSYTDYRINITATAESDLYSALSDKAKDMEANITRVKISRNNDGTIDYRFTLHAAKAFEPSELSALLEEHSEIKDISGGAV